MPQPVVSQHELANEPPSTVQLSSLESVRLGKIQPVSKPDFDKEVLAPIKSAQQKALDDCNAQGGSLTGLTCILPPPPPAPVYQAPVASYGQPDNFYKAFIYNHESGNNPAAINASSGACGLGQALPCSKLGCSLSDYACQDAWFTSYMLGRYQTWYNAYEFWLNHNWW